MALLNSGLTSIDSIRRFFEMVKFNTGEDLASQMVVDYLHNFVLKKGVKSFRLFKPTYTETQVLNAKAMLEEFGFKVVVEVSKTHYDVQLEE